MNLIREIASGIFFIIGILLTLNIIVDGFSWECLIGGVMFFVFAYFTWPSKKRGQRQGDNSFLDIIEFIIELPIDIFVSIFRFIVRLFKSKDGGFDLDI